MGTPLFEHTNCGRCGGSGRYSYNQIDGDRCFGCHGTGFALTRRGNAAQAFFTALLTVRAGDVTVGMRVNDRGGRKFTVAAIEQWSSDGWIVNGEKVQTTGVTFTSAQGNQYGYSDGILMTRIPTPDERAEMAAKALAYQDSLTRAGKPRARIAA